MLRTCFARKLCCCCCACDSNLRRLDIGLLGAINVEVYLLIVRRLIASHRNNYATLHRCRMVCIYDIVTVRKATENKLSDHTDRPRYAAHIDRTPTTRRPPPASQSLGPVAFIPSPNRDSKSSASFLHFRALSSPCLPLYPPLFLSFFSLFRFHMFYSLHVSVPCFSFRQFFFLSFLSRGTPLLVHGEKFC